MLVGVRVTEADVARIPVSNLRVPLSEFAALWILAEEMCGAQTDDNGWYSAGVAATCRWLASALSRPDGDIQGPVRAPATGRTARAYEELIDAELLTAERLAARDPQPAHLRRRPGWMEGIVDTLRWAWLHDGAPPLQAVSAEDSLTSRYT